MSEEKTQEIIGCKNEVLECFEILNDGKKYVILRGEDDAILVKILNIREETLWKFKTYLWYFGVRTFDELKNLNKNKITGIIDRIVDERLHYYFSESHFIVLWRVGTLLYNLLKTIDEAIISILQGWSTFTRQIKDIVTISCIFDSECNVSLELEYSEEGIDVFYSLLATDNGHLPLPIFLTYIGYKEGDFLNEEQIAKVKNVIYFVRGYETTQIPIIPRKHTDDVVREASSPLFEKAVALFNKKLIEEGIKDEDCPEGSLSDGMGYCRKINERLMTKSKDELINEILKELIEIREKITSYKKQLQENRG